MSLEIVGRLIPKAPALATCWLYTGAIGVAATFGEGTPVPVRLLITFTCIAIASTALWLAVRDALRNAPSPASNDSRLCPACSYPLLRSRDGLAWCPECGMNAGITKKHGG